MGKKKNKTQWQYKCKVKLDKSERIYFNCVVHNFPSFKNPSKIYCDKSDSS